MPSHRELIEFAKANQEVAQQVADRWDIFIRQSTLSQFSFCYGSIAVICQIFVISYIGIWYTKFVFALWNVWLMLILHISEYNTSLYRACAIEWWHIGTWFDCELFKSIKFYSVCPKREISHNCYNFNTPMFAGALKSFWYTVTKFHGYIHIYIPVLFLYQLDIFWKSIFSMSFFWKNFNGLQCERISSVCLLFQHN